MHRPPLLVLDEPTPGLDPLMQQEFERLGREVAGEGGTVFLSSHELDEVQRCADRVAIRPVRYASLLYWAVGHGQIDGGVGPGDYTVLVAVGIAAWYAPAKAFDRLDLG
jgi:hypothetical protein